MPRAAQGAAPLPLALKSTETGIAARTSLGTWRDYNSKVTAGKIDAANAFADTPMTAPKAASLPPVPFDIWSSIDTHGADVETAESTRTSVGADYKMSGAAKAGVRAERGRSFADAKTPTGDEKVAAYFALMPLRALTIDTQAQWERADVATGTPAAQGEKTSVTIAPRLKQPFDLGGGKTIEPYLTVKHEADFGSLVQQSATQNTRVIESAGAGITFAKPDTYSMTVSTDVDGLGGSEAATVKSQMQFKIPLR